MIYLMHFFLFSRVVWAFDLQVVYPGFDSLSRVKPRAVYIPLSNVPALETSVTILLDMTLKRS